MPLSTTKKHLFRISKFNRVLSLTVVSALLSTWLVANPASATNPDCDAITTSAVIDSENVTIKTINPTDVNCRILVPTGRFTAVITGGGGGGGGGASSSAGRGGGGGGGGAKAMGAGGTIGMTLYLTIGVGSGGAGGAAGVNDGAAATNGSSGEDSFVTIGGGVTYTAPGGSGGLAGTNVGGAGGNSGNGKTGAAASGLQGGQGGSSLYDATGATQEIRVGDTQSYTGTSVTRGSGGGGASESAYGLMGSQAGDGGRGGRGSLDTGPSETNGHNGSAGVDGQVIIIYWGTLVTEKTVTFDSNDGTSVDSCVTETDACSEPTPPTKEGEHFVGWYTDDETFENKVEFPYTPSGDVTLYAFWISYNYSKATLCSGQLVDITVSGIETGMPGPWLGGHYVSFGPTVTFEPWFNDEYMEPYRHPDTNFMAEGVTGLDYVGFGAPSGELKLIFYHNIGTEDVPVSGEEIFRSVINLKSSCSTPKVSKYMPATPNSADFTVSNDSGKFKVVAKYSGTIDYMPSSYAVQLLPENASCIIYGANSSCEITNLKNGVEYTVSISASNAYGTSAATALPNKYLFNKNGLFSFSAKKSLSGFAGVATKLTKSIKLKLKKYVSSNPTVTQVTCAAYSTENFSKKVDNKIAVSRAKTVCLYLAKFKPTITATVINKALSPLFASAKGKILISGYSPLINDAQ